MKIAVTGALGHIGSYLIRNLPNKFPEAEIIMIDNMMTQRYSTLFNLPSSVNYSFIEKDITKQDLRSLFDDIHSVIHLAAMTDASGSFDKAHQVEENNYEATRHVAEACTETGTRLISISSTSVYGTNNTVVSEDCSPEELKPQSPYASTKIKEEKLVHKLCLEKGLKGISCRFGTIFGASMGMRFHTAVNKFCWQAAMGQPITVWKTAFDQKRPYLDLTDSFRAICFIIHRDLFEGKIYNVLTMNATVQQIIEVIREYVPKLEISFIENQIMNQLSYEVSCEKFAKLGFTFKGDLHRGIAETIALLRQANVGKNSI